MPHKGFLARQLTIDHEPACMCHCIFVRINTHVYSKYHALQSLLHRATLRKLIYYRPQTKLGQGNIFRSMCQEFCTQGGGCGRGGMCGRGVCMAEGACMAGGCAWQGEGHAWRGGACMAGWVCDGGCMCGGGTMHGRGRACHPHTPDTTRYGQSMRGRCASNWNAFLSVTIITLRCISFVFIHISELYLLINFL